MGPVLPQVPQRDLQVALEHRHPPERASVIVEDVVIMEKVPFLGDVLSKSIEVEQKIFLTPER
jgi:hypothetical protein